MPATPTPGQTTAARPTDTRGNWFTTAAGRVILDSEGSLIATALAGLPAQPWLWLAPAGDPAPADASPGRGLRLTQDGRDWSGPVRCALPWPLPSESCGTVVLQHVLGTGQQSRTLVEECARVLAPGGTLWLFALNPLAPYRWRWRDGGLATAEPVTQRRRLRLAGLAPSPMSQGLGPRWKVLADPRVQDGPGLRAAYALCAEKRTIPLTPRRSPALRLAGAGAT